MTTGQSIYSDLDNKVSEVKREVDTLSRNVSSVENNISDLMNDRENNIISMAEFYLPELTATTIKDTIKEKQAVVQSIFKAKQERRADLEKAIDSAYTKQSELGTNLKNLNAQLDDAKTKRNTLRDQYLKLLDQDETYNKLITQTTEIKNRIDLNTARIEEVTKEAKQKIPEFENNNLFSYLLNKNFGTEKYHASNLIKKLDVWVSKLVDYDTNKKKYDTLKAMPELMNVELEERKDKLNKIVLEGKNLEQKYTSETGLADIITLGQNLEQKRTNLLNEMDSNTRQSKQYTQEKQSLDNNKDSYHQKAIAELKAYLKGESIAELKQRAKETVSTKDDDLVAAIENIDSKIREYKNSSIKLKEELNAKSEKYHELDDLLNKFRREGYDDSNSEFDSGFNINSLVTGYLLGSASSNSIWNQISDNQHTKPTYHSSPSYSSSNDDWHSSGGFGGSSSNDDSFSSGGGFGGSSSNDDSFSSGGGFGGSDSFSSGGGF